MIINDLDSFRTKIGPAKAYAPLVVDPDRMLALAVPLQCFQAIRGRHSQGVERTRRVEHAKLAARDRKDIRRKSLRALPLKDGLGYPVLEAPDHSSLRRLARFRISERYVSVKPHVVSLDITSLLPVKQLLTEVDEWRRRR